MQKHTQFLEQEQKIHIQNVLDYINLNDVFDTSLFNEKEPLYLVKLTENKTFTGVENRQETKVFERIVAESVKEQFLANPALIKNYQNESDFTYLIYPQEALEQMKTYGRQTNIMELLGVQAIEHKNNNMMNLIDEAQGILLEHTNSRGGFERSMFMNTEGEYFVEPLYFNDYTGFANNEIYDLDALAEYLIGLPNMLFVADKQWRADTPQLFLTPLRGNEKGIENLIHDIPSYNATEECSENLEFFLRPTQEQIQQMINWDKKSTPKCYNIEQFVLQYVLETQHLLKEPIVQEEEPTPKRKFKR